MSYFGEFLRRVHLKSIKLGPVTWDILPPEKIAVSTQQSASAIPASETGALCAPEPDMLTLNGLIRSLENFDLDRESTYYIGQTLVQCDSFLMDNGIIGEPLQLCEELINETDYSCADEALSDRRLSIKKINTLKRSLKKFRDDILRFEGSA